MFVGQKKAAADVEYSTYSSEVSKVRYIVKIKS
jgi:hypothetical protein